MADVGYITAAEAEAAKKKPIVAARRAAGAASRSRRTSSRTSARSSRAATARSSSTRTGSRFRPALDVRLQEAANRALDDGLRRIDKRRGFRKPRRNVVAEGHTIETFRHARWDRPMRDGEIVPAVVTAVDGADDRSCAPATLRVTIDRKGFAWTRQDGRRLSW